MTNPVLGYFSYNLFVRLPQCQPNPDHVAGNKTKKKASVEDLNADEDRQMGNCLLHVILEINVDGDLRQ